MGYFSQKKKHQRQQNTLLAFAVIFGLLTLLLFLPRGLVNRFPWLTAGYFQYYLLLLAAFAYALWLGRWRFAALYGFYLLLIFSFVASAANIFANARVPGRHQLNLQYSRSDPLRVSAEGMVLLRSGHLNLDEGIRAPFQTFSKNLQVFTVIAVDFEGLDAAGLKTAFRALRQFVGMQDDPVILYGHFGLPAWSPRFKHFLNQTGLSVKNRLLLLGKNRRFNLLAVPDFYVLAFDNVGVDSLEIAPSAGGRPLEVRLGLEYF